MKNTKQLSKSKERFEDPRDVEVMTRHGVLVSQSNVQMFGTIGSMLSGQH